MAGAPPNKAMKLTKRGRAALPVAARAGARAAASLSRALQLIAGVR